MVWAYDAAYEKRLIGKVNVLRELELARKDETIVKKFVQLRAPSWGCDYHE